MNGRKTDIIASYSKFGWKASDQGVECFCEPCSKEDALAAIAPKKRKPLVKKFRDKHGEEFFSCMIGPDDV